MFYRLNMDNVISDEQNKDMMAFWLKLVRWDLDHTT